ncbi:MAG: ankyrin repeat domain-containing protein, partial [Terriglobia bacterium]
RGPTVMGGMTALLFAARDGRTDAARALIESGAKIDNPGTGEKMTPLVMAIVNGHYDLAAYFLDRRANPNLANIEGLTALYATVDMQWAPYAYRPQPSAASAEISYLDLMKALLAHGANTNATLGQRPWFRSLPQDRTWVDPAGATTVWRAAQAADVDAMRLLVNAGADPKLANAEGDTPLMVAAGLGWATNFSRNVPGAWIAAVQYCLKLGLDVNARSAKGYTPLHGAAFIGDNPLIQFLVGQGADVRAVANDKNTVADMANGPIEHSVLHPDTVVMLEKLGSANSNNCRSDNCFVAVQSGRQRNSKDSAPQGKPPEPF